MENLKISPHTAIVLKMLFTSSSSSLLSSSLFDLFRPRLIDSSKLSQVAFYNFVYKFNIIFALLLLSILVTCRYQFDLFLHSFSSTGSTLNSSKIFAFLLWSKCVHPTVLLQHFFSIDISYYILYSKGPDFVSIYKNEESQCIMYFYFENLWTKVGLKLLFKISSI